MQTWTIDEMAAFKPCYRRERMVKLWAGRDRLSVLDIAALDIPIEDRIWALLTTGPHVKPAAERFVERAIRAVYEKCSNTHWRAWADKWLSGEDRSQKAASEAEAAAWAESEAAAWASAVASAAGAASAAAMARAESAATERERQLADIVEIAQQEGIVTTAGSPH